LIKSLTSIPLQDNPGEFQKWLIDPLAARQQVKNGFSR
jgi:hypothetical protein